MLNVQVVCASRHGGTAGIAERIAEVLRASGVDAVVADAADQPDPAGFDAYVIGSGVYMGSWLKEGIEFLDRSQSALAGKPVWLFSSGPLPPSSKSGEESDRLTSALGPEDGPGSGGRKKIAALAGIIQPRDHRIFFGAFDPEDPPRAMAERLVRLVPGSKKILPTGDWREWEAIEAWAREIGQELTTRVPVA
jgi:menaquinone-dependent protoporphyrinogen oxidase